MIVRVVQIFNYVVGNVYNWPPTWRNDFFGGNPDPSYLQLEQFQVDMGVDSGWLYQGGDFLPPPDTSPTFGRIITKLAYRMRFTQPERIAIKMVSLGLVEGVTSQMRAAVAVAEDDVMASNYIHLDRQDTIDGTENMEAAGLIAVGRATAILAPPVYSAELPSELRIKFGLPPLPTENELATNDGKGYTTVNEFLNDNP